MSDRPITAEQAVLAAKAAALTLARSRSRSAASGATAASPIASAPGWLSSRPSSRGRARGHPKLIGQAGDPRRHQRGPHALGPLRQSSEELEAGDGS
jgi:hypothetical protein